VTSPPKVDPYLKPLYDALYEMLRAGGLRPGDGAGRDRGRFPLAFMRGRTLNDSFIILDEAQKHVRRSR